MISLQQVGFSSLLPPNLQDTQTRALGAAWDKAFRKLVNYAERVSMTFAFVMELDEEMADHLCLSLDIKGYKADLSLQKKRLLIRSALLNYSRMGTKAALEDAVGIIHGGTTVQENWEYGGQPYFFRVAVDAGQEKVAENPVGRLLDTIMEYKNARSWLQGITVDVIEPGSVYTGALPEMGTMLVIDPYRPREMITDGKAIYQAMATHGAYLIIER
ncbi:phage tail protein [Negativibacillus massiliensis]|uniref:phage tail protein n=1 Tax=Negativibacillus massiliensis TaxID=1871035 RepID=UPI003AF24CA7